jgi:Tfp pilus assembly protein PilO
MNLTHEAKVDIVKFILVMLFIAITGYFFY